MYELRAAAVENVSELAGGSLTTDGGGRRAAERERLSAPLAYVYTANRCACVCLLVFMSARASIKQIEWTLSVWNERRASRSASLR